jgi:hypothetical protein
MDFCGECCNRPNAPCACAVTSDHSIGAGSANSNAQRHDKRGSRLRLPRRESSRPVARPGTRRPPTKSARRHRRQSPRSRSAPQGTSGRDQRCAKASKRDPNHHGGDRRRPPCQLLRTGEVLGVYRWGLGSDYCHSTLATSRATESPFRSSSRRLRTRKWSVTESMTAAVTRISPIPAAAPTRAASWTPLPR